MGTTLIFPCCVPDGEFYAEGAQHRAEQVVAASSLHYDETAEKFATWFYLPSVHDRDFPQRLDEAIARYGITSIFCPVPTARVVLDRLAAEGRLTGSINGA